MELLKIEKGYLTLLKGRPATGKTLVTIKDMVERCKAHPDDNIMYFSLEYTQIAFLKRIFNSVNCSLDDIKNINIISFSSLIDIDLLNYLIKKEHPSIVYIDYLNIIVGEFSRLRLSEKNKYDSKTQEEMRDKEVIDIIKKLANLAKELNIAIVATMLEKRSTDSEIIESKEVEYANEYDYDFNMLNKVIETNNLTNMLIVDAFTFKSKERIHNKIMLLNKDGGYKEFSSFDNDEYVYEKNEMV